MKATKETDMNEQIETFIIEASLIMPITDIISNLKNCEYRDCDISWLAKKLEGYTEIALAILGKKLLLPKLNYLVMNDFVKDRFLKYFDTLLNYFKSVCYV